MELTLNLGWVLVALAMMGAWLRIERTTKERRAQFIALAVVILILLPAISMTDDLLAAQNPAEIDCCVRRDDCSLHAHSSTPLLAALPLPVFKGLSFGIVQLPPLSRRSVPHVENPSLASIENRPPPVA
ncbi:MAG: hypothetical protein ABSD70_10425 [Terracidiphilus sp.]|jgi:hypothetical protein